MNGYSKGTSGVVNLGTVLTDDSQYGNKIDLVLDNTTYKLYAVLKNKSGTTLSTSTIIDLPIEELVVSMSYDSSAKELVVTLKSGTTTRVPIGAIVSGLESTTNKVTSIGDSSTDVQYPSAKSVKDYVGGLLRGKTYDFSSNESIYSSLKDIIIALGGSATNVPEKTNGYTVKVADNASVKRTAYLAYQLEGGEVIKWDQAGITSGSVIATNVTKIGLGGRSGLICGINYNMNGIIDIIESGNITWINLTGDLTITEAIGDFS